MPRDQYRPSTAGSLRAALAAGQATNSSSSTTAGGQALTPTQLRWGGAFIALWFVMDVIQFADMVRGWLP